VPFLKELLATITYQLPPAELHAFLKGQLQRLGLEIETESVDRGEIVARCLSLCFNMGLWRCWSDRILLRVRPRDTGSSVQVYALPNLLRSRVSKSERLVNLSEVVAALGPRLAE